MRHPLEHDRRTMPLAAILGLLMVSALNAQDVATTAETTAGTAWPDPATTPAQILSLEQIERSLLLDATNSRAIPPHLEHHTNRTGRCSVWFRNECG